MHPPVKKQGQLPAATATTQTSSANGGRGNGAGGRGGAAAGAQKKGGKNSAHTTTPTAGGTATPGGKKTTAPAQKWVVVIRNVDNDFSRVHARAVERYCCLNNKLATTNPQHASSSPCYTIKARTETRSAELQVFAPSDASDISSVWTPVPRVAPAAGDGVEDATAADEQGAPSSSVTEQQQQLGGSGRFSSVDDMTAVLKLKPYFTHPPLFMLGADEAAAADGADAEDETAGPRVLHGLKQAALVSAELVTSSHTTAKNLKKVLSDVPGFVTCWSLHAMHYRGVFGSEDAMFRTKTLLDQFEAEGLRITLVLPDVVARRYEAYLTRDAEA